MQVPLRAAAIVSINVVCIHGVTLRRNATYPGLLSP